MNSAHDLLGRVRVVLSHPSHPGNIGACARAMKTMGLNRLFLVNPLHFPHAEATALAANSHDILERASVCSSLDEALAGTVFTLASTARSRGIEHEVLDAQQAGVRLVSEAGRGEVALLMGTEKWGLSTAEISRCNVIGFIPCSETFSSLNLGAALQVFAYEIRRAAMDLTADAAPAGDAGDVQKDLPATHEEIEHLLQHWETVLYQVEFLNAAHPKKIMLRLRRLLARAQPERKEVRILRGFLTEMQRSLRPEALSRIPPKFLGMNSDVSDGND